MRKVRLKIEVELTLLVDEGVEMQEVVDELSVDGGGDGPFDLHDYRFGKFEVLDSN